VLRIRKGVGVFLRAGRCGAIILGMLVISPIAQGQRGAASLVGNVTDSTGALIADAEVNVTNLDTGAQRTTRTGATGSYTVTAIDVGNYAITTVKTGFKNQTINGIRVEYQQTIRVDVSLEVGNVQERVTVTATPPLLQTDEATTSTVIDGTKLRDLPLNGRNFGQLTQLIPGVTGGARGNGSTNFAAQGFALSAFGQRDFNNQFTLDGIDMTETRNPAPMFRPSIDAVEEFNVQTGLFSAEYGYKAGAHVNLAIRAGTNDLHGSAFEFLRNKVMDARSFFSAAVSPLIRNQFGATLGGPIKRNRLFFFGAFDGTRERRATTLTGRVPELDLLKGDFSRLTTPIIDPSTGAQFPGNQIPASRLDPRSKLLMTYYPAPNTVDPLNRWNYIRTGSGYDDDSQAFGRIDYRLGEKDTLFGRYAISDRKFGSPPLIDPFGDVNPFIAQNATLQEVHIFSPRVLAEAQLGYSRYHREITSLKRFPELAQQLAIPGLDTNPLVAGFPVINIQNYATIGEGSINPLMMINESKQAKGAVSIITGAHSIKAGVLVMRIRNQQTFPLDPRGSFSFRGSVTGNPVSDFLIGRMQSTTNSVGLTPARIFTTLYHAYVTDDWKIRPNLTLNLGLRYEANPPVQDQRGLARNFDLATGTLFPDLGQRVRLYNFDKNNFAPRLSFAYRPFDSRTVLRGGAGVFYSMPEFNTLVDFNLNPPMFASNSFREAPSVPLSFDNAFPLGAQQGAGAPSIYAVDRNGYRDAFTLLWNFDIQRQFGSNIMVDIGYTGSKTTGLLAASMPNQPTPGAAAIQSRRRFPQWGIINYWTPMAFSTYHGLTAKVDRRFSGGLFFLASYTWSKAIDIIQSPVFGDNTSGNSQNKDNIFAEKARAGFDRAHRLSFSSGYELPFGKGRKFGGGMSRLEDAVIGGWQLGGILTLETGSPFSVFVQGDPAGIGGDGTLRANRIADGRLTGDARSLYKWFDTSAFTPLAPYTFGNSGRNVLVGPGTSNLDCSIFKNFVFERFKLQLRGEAFNVLNHANFAPPQASVGNPNFGRITSTANRGRELQVALKLSF